MISSTFDTWNNIPKLAIIEVILAHWNLFNNSYQQDSSLLDTFIPKQIIWSILKIINPNFWYIETWFTDQNSKPLERKFKSKFNFDY